MGANDNFEKLSIGLAGLSPVPLMSRELFAQSIGLPVGVVNSWADRGYLMMYPIGRYSLVNLELLRKQCLDKEFKL